MDRTVFLWTVGSFSAPYLLGWIMNFVFKMREFSALTSNKFVQQILIYAYGFLWFGILLLIACLYLLITSKGGGKLSKREEVIFGWRIRK